MSKENLVAGEFGTSSHLPSRVNGQVRFSKCIGTSKVEHEATVISRSGEHGRGRRAPKRCTYNITLHMIFKTARREAEIDK